MATDLTTLTDILNELNFDWTTGRILILDYILSEEPIEDSYCRVCYNQEFLGLRELAEVELSTPYNYSGNVYLDGDKDGPPLPVFIAEDKDRIYFTETDGEQGFRYGMCVYKSLDIYQKVFDDMKGYIREGRTAFSGYSWRLHLEDRGLTDPIIYDFASITIEKDNNNRIYHLVCPKYFIDIKAPTLEEAKDIYCNMIAPTHERFNKSWQLKSVRLDKEYDNKTGIFGKNKILIDFPNKELRQLTPFYIADNYATYICNIIHKPDTDDWWKEYESAYDEIINNEKVLIAWLRKLKWEDIKSNTRLISRPETVYDLENATIIISKEEENESI